MSVPLFLRHFLPLDLLGDLVTLFCWRFSRKPPTAAYPYGFGKFETLGTTTVALLLIGAALGIGFHSFQLLVHHLVETAATMPPGPAQSTLQNISEVTQNLSHMVDNLTGNSGHSHSHGVGHGAGEVGSAKGVGLLDPNAAWFALASVIVKEWIYRATKRVADAEKSPVLLANAIHHRSDAYTSAVALVAILGTWYYPALPLDPIGGACVVVLLVYLMLNLFF